MELASDDALLISRTVDRCRVCNSSDLYRYLDMGKTPLANSYLASGDLGKPEFAEDLCIQLCPRCGLSQLTKVVHPDRMFKHYLYVSSTTNTIRDHFSEFAHTTAKVAGAKPGDLALDIASNDGCLLKAFQEAGLDVLGVDPAENLAKEANARGLRTECAYWSESLAADIAQRIGRPKIITAANVFAHVDDLQEFMRGVSAALAPDGIFVIECPYVVDFIEKAEFDTAYHEHLSYIGITPLKALMDRHNFEVFDVEYFPMIHGGTIRVYCARRDVKKVSARVDDFLKREEKLGVRRRETYGLFSRNVNANRGALRSLVQDLVDRDQVVWAYGASAKGNTLMNFFGLREDQVPVVIDDNPKKWELFSPGAHMRIVGIEALKTAKVDYLLLLAWNFEQEIRRRCQAAGYKGKFIIPVPKARVTFNE